MALELEELIASLLVFISCAGEQGCTVLALLDAIEKALAPSEDSPEAQAQAQAPAHIFQPPELLGNTSSQHSAASTIWRWLVERDDLSVGNDREYNHLSLDDVLALSQSGSANHPATTQTSQGGGSTSATPVADSRHASTAAKAARGTPEVTVRVSERTMWESITGHSVDYRRVPRSEWLLLLGIASTRRDGILQGDLGRLVDQDKRSVPKRTDALVSKGYIIKRTTLVRRTKTSKLWLKSFAPPLPRESETADDSLDTDMNLSRQVLVSNLDAVPWHSRWTGDSIDFTALAKTIMALAKEWDVIRIHDLKMKLGVLGMRWQMKVLAKVCRFLNERGATQYVAAMLEGKVFKDCIKYQRALTPKDWSSFLATGKRASRPYRLMEVSSNINTEGQEDLVSTHADISRISMPPPWSLDTPMSATIAQAVTLSGSAGLTNPDLYGLTLGPLFSRYISSWTMLMSSSSQQHQHLRHMQLRSEHIRAGKVASYRYFSLPDPFMGPAENNDTSSSAPVDEQSSPAWGANAYGFPSSASLPPTTGASTTLTELCKSARSIHKFRRHPQEGAPVKSKPVSKDRVRRPARRVSQRAPKVPSEELPVASSPRSVVQASRAPSPLETTEKPSLPSQETGDVTVTLKAQPGQLKTTLETAQEAETVPLQSLSTSAETVEAGRKSPTHVPDGTGTASHAHENGRESDPDVASHPKTISHEMEDSIVTEEQDSLSQHETSITQSPARGRGRGRGRGRSQGQTRGRGRGRGRASIGRPKAEDAGGRRWVCEKCGGTWKNDIGLKYHLEKSRTPCNPSFDPTTVEPVRRPRRPRIQVSTSREPSPTSPDDNNNITSANSANDDAANTPVEAKAADPETEAEEEKEAESETELPVSAQSTPKSSSVSNWRRPPAADFRKRLSSGSVVKNQGALLSPKATQSRQVVLPPHRPHPVKETPSRRRESSTVDPAPQTGDDAASAAIPEAVHDTMPGSPGRRVIIASAQGEMIDDSLIHPALHSMANGSTASPMPSHVTPDKRVKNDSPQTLSRAEFRSRLCEVIENQLASSEGIMPGGDFLHRTVSEIWESRYHHLKAPSTKEVRLALKWLVERKMVSEHWHAYRARDGTFAKCQIITTPGIGAFSPGCLQLVETIKAGNADALEADGDEDVYTEQTPTRGKGARRGRRLLAREVAVLNAPVYVQQIAAKNDPSSNYSNRGRKRYPQSDKTKSKDIALAGQVDAAGQFEIILNEMTDLSPKLQPAPQITFLDPNTFLGPESADPIAELDLGILDEPETWNSVANTRSKKRKRADSLSCEIRGPEESVPMDVIHGASGVWPYLDIQYFEQQDSSHTLQGWIPDMDWFSWATIESEIDKEAASLRSKRRDRELPAEASYVRFLDRLRASHVIEMRRSHDFVNPASRAVVPYNIYIPFFPEQDTHYLDVPSIEWSESAQLTPGSSALVDELNILSGDSSGEDDEVEWNIGYNIPPPLPRSKLDQPRSEPKERGSIKRVPLMSRALTSLPPQQQPVEAAPESKPASGEANTVEDSPDIMAAFVAVRVLLGGTDKSIDWGLLLHIFPDMTIADLRRSWVHIRKQKGPQISSLTREFQDKFLVAYENDEIPVIDYEDIMNYDWARLIEWTVQLTRKPDTSVLPSKTKLDGGFTLEDAETTAEDWREKYYHVQSSVQSRLDAATSEPGAVSLNTLREGPQADIHVTDHDVARSWIRSLCQTPEDKYSVQEIKARFVELSRGNQAKLSSLLTEVIDQLTQQRIIRRIQKPALRGRPYGFSEWYAYSLSKLAQRSKYHEAVAYKEKLDDTFRRGETMTISYTLTDGATMALMNLSAHGRIKLVPVDVPHIPFGFEPGNYESRKFPKSYYHFGLAAVPTETYHYNEDIDVLTKSIQGGLPSKSQKREVPQWIDFLGEANHKIWADILGSVCFACATRGLLTVEAICGALTPVLEPFEAQLIIEWGHERGILRELRPGLGVTVGEWWWLAVPWQNKRLSS
ncbi:hypothetical protein B0I35DRAFT_252402 [Stachybotrys elegans]|uniref:Uncharacterized protein n=1 Tax=Stachybotrys elegans TaxID=80388 RepID=A0A8K0WSR0_9HYPO|nr:hypothetical protein B0I35DRAFT_252402 [Stachybotrys elegans]